MRKTEPPPTTTIITGRDGRIRRVRSPIQKKCGEVPPWVLVMINLEYQECKIHLNPKGNNKFDRFCINCVGSFCSKCSSNHHGHNYIQIRRYMYCDVVNRPDFQRHFDCSGIQGYVTNKNKVLFLKRRGALQQQVEEQQPNTRDHNCIICNHSLTDSYYCSIQCKVAAMYNTVNTKEATVDNNVGKTDGEGSENGLHNAKEDPASINSKRKRSRKEFPHRAPLF